jgi:hypothetical protein
MAKQENRGAAPARGQILILARLFISGDSAGPSSKEDERAKFKI